MPIDSPRSSSQPAGSAQADIERAEQLSSSLAAYVATMRHGRHDEAARETARNALSHYVRGVKRDRLTPEQALVRVKAVSQPLVARIRGSNRDAFAAEILRWFIEAYFGARSENGRERTLEA